MNGTSGFQEVRSSTSRSSTNRLLQEQRHQFGTCSRDLSCTNDLIFLSSGISTMREKVPDTFSPDLQDYFVILSVKNMLGPASMEPPMQELTISFCESSALSELDIDSSKDPWPSSLGKTC
jgi:hypothetical protein